MVAHEVSSLRGFWFALVLLMAAGVQAPAAFDGENADDLFMWTVRSQSATVHLLGSVHVGMKDFYPLDPTIENLSAIGACPQKWCILPDRDSRCPVPDAQRLNSSQPSLCVLSRSFSGELRGSGQEPPLRCLFVVLCLGPQCQAVDRKCDVPAERNEYASDNDQQR